MDQVVKDHLAVLDKNDPEKKIGLMIDEWGTWYADADASSSALYQQNSLRDALVAALSFHIFHAEDLEDRGRAADPARRGGVAVDASSGAKPRDPRPGSLRRYTPA